MSDKVIREVIMELNEAKEYLSNNNVPLRFGFRTVSDEFLIRKARGLKHLEEYGDVWECFPLSCGGYNEEIDFDVYNILESIMVNKDTCKLGSVEHLKLPKKYVELVKYILCSGDLADYGGSPRGCWATEYGEAVFTKWKEYRSRENE